MNRLTNKETLKKMDSGELHFQQHSPQEIYFKLGKIEDILEKYGIESVEELERHLSYTVEYDVITRLEHDRDTWKKACELACKHINVLCEHQIIEACYVTRHPACPLLSLADHDKQKDKKLKQYKEKIKMLKLLLKNTELKSKFTNLEKQAIVLQTRNKLIDEFSDRLRGE